MPSKPKSLRRSPNARVASSIPPSVLSSPFLCFRFLSFSFLRAFYFPPVLGGAGKEGSGRAGRATRTAGCAKEGLASRSPGLPWCTHPILLSPFRAPSFPSPPLTLALTNLSTRRGDQASYLPTDRPGVAQRAVGPKPTTRTNVEGLFGADGAPFHQCQEQKCHRRDFFSPM